MRAAKEYPYIDHVMLGENEVIPIGLFIKVPDHHQTDQLSIEKIVAPFRAKKANRVNLFYRNHHFVGFTINRRIVATSTRGNGYAKWTFISDFRNMNPRIEIIEAIDALRQGFQLWRDEAYGELPADLAKKEKIVEEQLFELWERATQSSSINPSSTFKMKPEG